LFVYIILSVLRSGGLVGGWSLLLIYLASYVIMFFMNSCYKVVLKQGHEQNYTQMNLLNNSRSFWQCIYWYIQCNIVLNCIKHLYCPCNTFSQLTHEGLTHVTNIQIPLEQYPVCIYINTRQSVNYLLVWQLHGVYLRYLFWSIAIRCCIYVHMCWAPGEHNMFACISASLKVLN